MSLCNYGCAAITEQELVICNQYPKGGISAWAVVNCGVTFIDITSAAEWTTKIAANDVTVFKNVTGEVPFESPDFVESPVACEEDIRAGATHNAIITDANVNAANLTSYPNLNNTRGYIVFYNCEEDTIYYQLEKLVRFDSKFMIPKSNKEFQMFQIDIAWRNASLQLATAPDGIFDE